MARNARAATRSVIASNLDLLTEEVSLSALALPHAVELRVADTGPGIPSAQLDAVFEPFVRVHSSDEADRPGAGLGLTIARNLTHLMGGELLVRSVIGVGSLFAARFPAA